MNDRSNLQFLAYCAVIVMAIFVVLAFFVGWNN